jgi:hypothetical protein
VMDFFDAHFHIWDLSEDTLSGHDASILFAPGGDPVYTVERYENEFTALPKELVHTGGVRLVPCSALSYSADPHPPVHPATCICHLVLSHGHGQQSLLSSDPRASSLYRSIGSFTHTHAHAHACTHTRCTFAAQVD